MHGTCTCRYNNYYGSAEKTIGCGPDMTHEHPPPLNPSNIFWSILNTNLNVNKKKVGLHLLLQPLKVEYPISLFQPIITRYHLGVWLVSYSCHLTCYSPIIKCVIFSHTVTEKVIYYMRYTSIDLLPISDFVVPSAWPEVRIRRIPCQNGDIHVW